MKTLIERLNTLRLSKFKVGNKVEILYLPKTSYCKTNGFKGLVCTIEDIELKEKFINGFGSMTLKIIDGGTIVATGIVSKNVKLKLI